MRITPDDGTLPVVSIIIVVSSAKMLLKGCLESIDRCASPDIPHEVIVVLNAVPEDVERQVRRIALGTNVVSSPINLGFAGGTNRGRAEARGEFIHVLHDDSIVTPGWLDALLTCARSYPEAGAIMSKILFPDGTFQCTGWYLFSDGEHVPTVWVDADVSERGHRVRPIDSCGSSSLFVPASAWDAVGGFDDDMYPAYNVDTTFSIALQQSGYSILCDYDSLVHHYRGSSTGRYDKIFYDEKNKQRLKSKWAHALAQYVDKSGRPVPEALSEAEERCLTHFKTERPRVQAERPHGFDAQRQASHIALNNINSLTEFGAFVAKRQLAEQSSIPIYRPGTILSFSKGGNGRLYTAEGGLHDAEGWGTWIRDRLTLLLPLVQRPLDLPPLLLSLHLTATHLLNTHRPASGFVVRVNGSKVHEQTEERPGIHRYRIDLEPLISDVLAITIDVKQPMTPAHVGLGSDLRSLGMAVHDLSVTVGQGSPVG